MSFLSFAFCSFSLLLLFFPDTYFGRRTREAVLKVGGAGVGGAPLYFPGSLAGDREGKVGVVKFFRAFQSTSHPAGKLTEEEAEEEEEAEQTTSSEL